MSVRRSHSRSLLDLGLDPPARPEGALAAGVLAVVVAGIFLNAGVYSIFGQESIDPGSTSSGSMLAKTTPKPKPEPQPSPPPPEPKPKRPPDPMAGIVETYLCPPAPAGLLFPDCWTTR